MPNLHEQPRTTSDSSCKHLGEVFREFGTSSRTCQNPQRSKTWAIAQGFCSKSVDLGTLQILAKSSRTTPCNVGNPVPNIWAKFLGSLGRDPEPAKIGHVQNHGNPGILLKIGRFGHIANSCQIFTNNPVRRWKSSSKHLGKVFREFGTSSRTCQNPQCSKTWAIAQGFCSKSVDLGTLQILAKSSRITPDDVRNPFPSIWAKFLGSLGRDPEVSKIL